MRGGKYNGKNKHIKEYEQQKCVFIYGGYEQQKQSIQQEYAELFQQKCKQIF